MNYTTCARISFGGRDAGACAIMGKDIAWAAGFIDGEGCLTVGRQWRNGYLRHWPVVNAANTNRRNLEALSHIFRLGSVSEIYNSKMKRRTWIWRVNGRKTVKRVLERMLPYLRGKEREARLLIDFTDLPLYGGRTPTPIEDVAQRDAYYWALRKAKEGESLGK